MAAPRKAKALANLWQAELSVHAGYQNSLNSLPGLVKSLIKQGLSTHTLPRIEMWLVNLIFQ